MRFCFLFCVTFAVVFIPAPAYGRNEPARAPGKSFKPPFEKIVDAIYKIEGGARTRHPFGILSVACNGYSDCRRVCLATVKNNFRRWEKAGRPGDYLEFLARKYAPIGAENDPGNLNRNWLKNLRRVLK